VSVILAVHRKGLSKILNIRYINIIYYSTEKGVVQKTEHHIHIIYHFLHRKGLSKNLNITNILYIKFYSTEKGVVQNTEHYIH